MSQRLTWPDTAKGLTILLVTILHGTMWIGYLGTPSTFLSTFNTIFSSMRMPLFFCIAGIFASKWIAGEWHNLRTSKLSVLIWVFIAWQPVFFAFKYAAAMTLPGQDPSLVGHLARMIASPVRPNGETWFLWALVIYFMVAKMLKHLPPFIHLLIAGIVSVTFSGVVRPWLGSDIVRLMGTGLEMMAPLYFFFVCGLIFRRNILTLCESLHWWIHASVFFGWLMAAWIAAATGSSRAPGIEFVLQILGAAAGIALGNLLQHARWLQRIGQNTLPIYVGHMVFISIAVMVAYGIGIRSDREFNALSLSVVIALFSVCASLFLWKISRNNILRHLYTSPIWFERLLKPVRKVPRSSSNTRHR